jgi:hypothetical protein
MSPALLVARKIGFWLLLVLIVVFGSSELCLGPIAVEAAPAATAPSDTSALVAGMDPASTQPVFLPLVVSRHPASTNRTSDELIDRAIAAGQLDSQTGLIYRVYATFNDPRLPTRYRGDDSALHDSHALDLVQAQWDSLSAASQDALRPFLTPPIYSGSWYGLRYGAAGQGRAAEGLALPEGTYPVCSDVDRRAWASDVGRVAHIKVWWPSDVITMSVTAQAFISEMDSTIWPKLTGLMGLPLRDSDSPCGGDDSRLDIYLTGTGGTSTAPQLQPPGCKQTPAYITMQSTSPDVLAHEFMHTIQWGYKTAKDCMYSTNEYAWLSEATAEWAMDFVYPSHDKEHESANAYLSKTDEPLRLWNRSHEYGAYLLPLFIAKTQSSTSIRTIWDNTLSMGALDAVDKVLPGGFKQTWQQFARYNWNRAPYDLHKSWDRLTQGATLKVDSKMAPPKLVEAYAVGPDRLKSLTAQYYRLTFDATARSVAFYNGLAFKVSAKEIVKNGNGYAAEPVSDEQKKGAMVEALIKIDDQWRMEDWSGRDVVSFCRDKKDERVQELVLIYGNTAFDPVDYELRVAGEKPTLVVSQIGCWQWEGSVRSQQVESDGTTWTQNGLDLLYERIEPGVSPGVGYKLKRGTLHWSVSGSDPCGPTGSGTIPLTPIRPGDAAAISSFNGIVSGSLYGHLGAASWLRTSITWDECGNPVTTWLPYNWGVMNPAQQGLNPDGSLSATYTLGIPDGPEWTWDLKPVTEP